MVKGVRGIKALVVKTACLAHPLAEQENGFSVGREPVRANNMKNDAKIRQDLLSLECFAHPNNPRQGAVVRALASYECG